MRSKIDFHDKIFINNQVINIFEIYFSAALNYNEERSPENYQDCPRCKKNHLGIPVLIDELLYKIQDLNTIYQITLNDDSLINEMIDKHNINYTYL